MVIKTTRMFLDITSIDTVTDEAIYKILDNNLSHSVIRIYEVGKLTCGDIK